MTNPTRTKILFDNNKAYVMAKLPDSESKFKIRDRLNRSPEELKFLKTYIRIFEAAANGNLKTCQTIFEKEKFHDIDAYSMGAYCDDETGKSLDGFSIRGIAAHYGHEKITDYFSQQIAKSLPPSEKQIQTRTSLTPKFKTKNEEKAYEECKRLFSTLLATDASNSELMLSTMRSKLLEAYAPGIREEVQELFNTYDYNLLLGIIHQQCNNIETTKPLTSCRVELYALRDALPNPSLKQLKV